MSSLGGQGNEGSSINPGVPGSSGGGDLWYLYPAEGDVDFGGFTIKNANIDLCNDSLENVVLLNSTLSGTTTLQTDHTFTGSGVFGGTLAAGATTLDSAVVTGALAAGATTLGTTLINGNTTVTRQDTYGAIRTLTGGAPDLYFGHQNPASDLYGYQINANIANETGDFGCTVDAKTGAGTNFENVMSFVSTASSGRPGIVVPQLIRAGEVDVTGNITSGGIIKGAASGQTSAVTIGTTNITIAGSDISPGYTYFVISQGAGVVNVNFLLEDEVFTKNTELTLFIVRDPASAFTLSIDSTATNPAFYRAGSAFNVISINGFSGPITNVYTVIKIFCSFGSGFVYTVENTT